MSASILRLVPVLVLMPAMAAAQEGVRMAPGTGTAGMAFSGKPYRLTFDHVARTWTAADEKNRVKVPVQPVGAGAFVLELPPGRPIEIVVTSANPLLYDYTVDPKPLRSDGVRACGDVGRGFAQSGFLVAVGAVRNMNEPAPPVEGLLAVPTTAPDRGDRARLAEDELEASLQAARPAVTALVVFLERLAALPTELQDSLAALAERSDAEPLGPSLDRLVAMADRLTAGLGRTATVPVVVSNRVVSAQTSTVAVAKASLMIREGRYDGNAAGTPAREALALEQRFKALTAPEALTKTVRDLQLQLRNIERYRTRLTQSVALPASGDSRRLVLTLGKSDDFPDVVRIYEGSVEAFLQPRTGLLCQISTGFNLMTSHAKYQLTSDRELLDVADDDVRTSPALFFHFTPSRFNAIGLAAGIGLGTERAPDLYAGVSLRHLAPVLLNGGIVWQRHRIAPDGMRPGTTVPDGLRIEDFDRRYTAGWFFGVSIAP